MNDFWFPLERFIFATLPKISDFQEELMLESGWGSFGMLVFLKWNGTAIVTSYSVSLFFLFNVFHATKMIDYRIITT